MKKAQILYTSWEGTPLKWHKYLLVTAPIGVVITLGSLVYSFATNSADVTATIQAAGGGWVFLWDTVLYVATIVLATTAFVGLLKRRWYGVNALLLGYIFQMVYGIAGLALAGSYEQLLTTLAGDNWYAGSIVGEFVMNSIRSFVTGAVLFFPNRVYYRKRRLLFSPAPQTTGRPAVAQHTAVREPESESSVALLAQLRDECEAEQAAKQQPKLPDPKSPDRSPTALKLLCGALGCACIVLLLCCVHQAGTTERLESELAQASRDATYFEGRMRYLEEEVSFWESSAVIVLEDDYYYHTYGCPKLKNPGKYYYIYDAVDTLYYGFEPCSECDP